MLLLKIIGIFLYLLIHNTYKARREQEFSVKNLSRDLPHIIYEDLKSIRVTLRLVDVGKLTSSKNVRESSL